MSDVRVVGKDNFPRHIDLFGASTMLYAGFRISSSIEGRRWSSVVRRSPAVRRSREAAAALLKLELEGDTVLMYDRTYL